MSPTRKRLRQQGPLVGLQKDLVIKVSKARLLRRAAGVRVANSPIRFRQQFGVTQNASHTTVSRPVLWQIDHEHGLDVALSHAASLIQFGADMGSHFAGYCKGSDEGCEVGKPGTTVHRDPE